MVVSSKGFRVEGHHFYHTIVIRVRTPPEKTFTYVTDIGRHNEWSTNSIRFTPLTQGPVRLGSKYAAVGRQWGKDWPSELEVTRYELPRRFEFTATGGPVGAPAGDPYRREFLLTPRAVVPGLKSNAGTPYHPAGLHG